MRTYLSKNVEVVVVKCTDSEDYAYDHVSRDVYPNLDAANAIAKGKCEKGICVIVRPMYLETNAEGKEYFREWRSWNGKPFVECAWHSTFG